MFIHAGQPLSILGATGPFLAYTLVVYDLADGADIESRFPSSALLSFFCLGSLIKTKQ